tara:strand:+ start:204 stop:362 length:159 start_codon:yes stop_codon:yes gene_type:complete
MITVDRKHNGMLELWYYPDGSTFPIRMRYMGYTEPEARSLFVEYLKSQGVEA